MGSVYFFGKSADINDGWIKYAQGFIQDFELGAGGKQGGSRMIVVCETHAC